MKAKKRIVRESRGDVDLFIRTHSMRQMGRHKEFDREFAKELEAALEQFANKKKMTPDEVMDGGDNLMSEFANWAKKSLRLDIDKYMPSAEEFVEGSGSGMSDTDIVNWIGEELEECEWVDDISYSDDIGLKSAQVAIKVRDKVFIVSVEEDAGAAKQLLGWNEDEI